MISPFTRVSIASAQPCECLHPLACFPTSSDFFSQTRYDAFRRAHAISGCPNHDDRADPADFRFTTNIFHAHADEKVKEYLRRGRRTIVDLAVARLESMRITDRVVSRVMDDWDVVPDAICQVLRRNGYICFAEEDIEAHDTVPRTGART